MENVRVKKTGKFGCFIGWVISVLLIGALAWGFVRLYPRMTQATQSVYLEKKEERYQNRLEEYGIDLQGSIIFHTAVSPAGVGPTSSNKLEIEGSFPALSKAGVRLHLGKGALSAPTIQALDENHSVFTVIPPVTALLESLTSEREVVAFPELGMEALHRIKVENYQAIIAAAHGKSIY